MLQKTHPHRYEACSAPLKGEAAEVRYREKKTYASVLHKSEPKVTSPIGWRRGKGIFPEFNASVWNLIFHFYSKLKVKLHLWQTGVVESGAEK